MKSVYYKTGTISFEIKFGYSDPGFGLLTFLLFLKQPNSLLVDGSLTIDVATSRHVEPSRILYSSISWALWLAAVKRDITSRKIRRRLSFKTSNGNIPGSDQ